MANASRVTGELGDYKAFYKDVFIRAAICEVDKNLTTIRLPASAVKNFAKSASIRPMSFAPKIKIDGIYNGVKFSLSEATRIPKRRDAGNQRLGGAKFTLRDSFCIGDNERYAGF